MRERFLPVPALAAAIYFIPPGKPLEITEQYLSHHSNRTR